MNQRNNRNPKWSHPVAVSALHKMLRVGNMELAQYAASCLMSYEKGQQGAWRRVLAFPAEDNAGVGVEQVIALYHSFRAGAGDECIYMAIRYLCQIVNRQGYIDRSADELKNACVYWLQGGRTTTPWMPFALKHGEDPQKVASIHMRVAMTNGKTETAAHIACWLMTAQPSGHKKKAKELTWETILNHSARNNSQNEAGALYLAQLTHLQALYSAWRSGYEDDNLYAGILRVCNDATHRIAKADPSLFWATTDKLKYLQWQANNNPPPVPEEANDVHVGQGTVDEWWAGVNKLGPASIWRKDAMKMVVKPKEPKMSAKDKKAAAQKAAGQQSLF